MAHTVGLAGGGLGGGGGEQLHFTLGLELQFRLFCCFLLLGGWGTCWGVGEVERSTCGDAGVYGDPLLVRGVDVGSGGGPCEEGLEGGGWHGHEVGVLSDGRFWDSEGGAQGVGEDGGQLLDIRCLPDASHAGDRLGGAEVGGRSTVDGWGVTPGGGGAGAGAVSEVQVFGRRGPGLGRHSWDAARNGRIWPPCWRPALVCAGSLPLVGRGLGVGGWSARRRRRPRGRR